MLCGCCNDGTRCCCQRQLIYIWNINAGAGQAKDTGAQIVDDGLFAVCNDRIVAHT